MQEHINNIVSSWAEGEFWHERSSITCFYLGFRGLGRWHWMESCGDGEARKEFSKYCADYCKIIPDIDPAHIQRALTYKLTERGQLESHLAQWVAREEKFIKDIKNTITKLSTSQDFTLYRMLCCYLEEIENERMFVGILLENLRYNQFAAHHVTQVMKELHRYFEHEYKGGTVDFSIT